jgi:hypothetical protein
MMYIMMRMDRWIEPINKYGWIDESVENSVEVILVLQPGAFDSNLFWWARRSFSNNSKMKGGEGGGGWGREAERREKNLFQICRKSKNKHKFYIFKSLDHSFFTVR